MPVRLVGCVALLCLGGVALGGDQAKKDLDRFQGVWRVEKVIDRGEPAPAEIIAKLTLTFKGDELIPSDNPKDIGKITLDPSQKPAAFDLVEKSKKKLLGIYLLEGDTLKLCFSEGGARPTAFESTKGTRIIYIELKRAKK